MPAGATREEPSAGLFLDRDRGPTTIVAVSRLSRVRAGVRVVWAVLRTNPLTLIGFLLVAVISVTAFLVYATPLITQLFLGRPVSILPYSLAVGQFPNFLGPSWAHPFGTDGAGQDVLSKVLAALPIDLAIGFSIVGFSLFLGGGLGLVAGYWDKPGTWGGALSVTILRITDVFLAFPSLVLALAIAAALGRDFVHALLAIAATWWPYYVRLIRGEVLAVKNAPFVTAARAAGLSDGRILVRHVLRNILEPIVVYFTLDVGSVLIVFSTITFLGIGPPPGVPEWGSMISAYQGFLSFDAWPTLFAGLSIFITVLAFSLLGDGLRDVLDPRSRRALAISSSGAEEPLTPGMAPLSPS